MRRKIKIVKFAYLTRIITVLVQFVANNLIPDHDANVFTYPKFNSTGSFGDATVDILLGGFVRWDAHYIMHIAKYGYTHENTLAFFPLYPLIVKTIATALSYVIVFLNEDSILLVTFVSLNVYIFVKAAIVLYELTSIILNEDLGYKSAVLFCINPATIFFVAPYTECLFSYLSFKCMLNCALIYVKRPVRYYNVIFKSMLYIVPFVSLSACVRSNGILNIGFVVYFLMRCCIKDILIVDKVYYGMAIVLIAILCLVPFTFVQIYDYYKFCTNHKHNLDKDLVNFVEGNLFVLPGSVSRYKQSWCFNKIPLAYSYIQEHYWNVGFLRYFEIKQTPNFMLAIPTIAFVIRNSLKFFRSHKNYCLNLGMFNFKYSKSKCTKSSFTPEMFVFIVHAAFLTIFCTFCIHVQVTTRMICSASPILYWFAACEFENVREGNGNLFIFDKIKSRSQKCILTYFCIYCVIGIVMFSNFLPWT